MSNYHPRRKDREVIDQSEIERLLKTSKYVIIGMAKDNDPYLVTLSYGYDENTRTMYFHCALSGQKIDYLRSNSNVCATIIEDHGYLKTVCEHAYLSLIIRGKMEIVQDLNEKKIGLSVLLKHLEEDPDPIFKRNIKDDSSYDKVTIMKMKIESVYAKQYKDIEK